MPRRLTRIAGFTLLELLVVIAIAGILLTTALPELSLFGLRAARSQGASTLYIALNQARAEAVARNRRVAVCARDYFSSASRPLCAASPVWAQGWLVYLEPASGAGGTRPAEAADLIGAYEPVGRVTAEGDNAFQVEARFSQPAVRFLASGRPQEAGAFVLCERSGRLTEARRIALARSGHLSIESLDAARTEDECG